MTALATLEELKNNLDWSLDTAEELVAESDLEHASNLVRAEGLPWTPANVPPIVKTIVLQAVRRHMVNLQGLTVSRAGDESLGWADIGDKAGSVYLTEDERRTIQTISRGNSTFGSMRVFAWSSSESPNGPFTVPTNGAGGKPLPWYSSDTEPW